MISAGVTADWREIRGESPGFLITLLEAGYRINGICTLNQRANVSNVRTHGYNYNPNYTYSIPGWTDGQIDR